jgi:hypothetical protein
LGADPFIGTWKLDLSKWDFDPDTGPRQLTMKVSEDGTKLRFVSDGTSWDYKPMHMEDVVDLSGVEAPRSAEGPKTDTVVSRRVNANTIETTFKKNGKTVSMITRTIAGKTLTVTMGLPGKLSTRTWVYVRE